MPLVVSRITHRRRHRTDSKADISRLNSHCFLFHLTRQRRNRCHGNTVPPPQRRLSLRSETECLGDQVARTFTCKEILTLPESSPKFVSFLQTRSKLSGALSVFDC